MKDVIRLAAYAILFIVCILGLLLSLANLGLGILVFLYFGLESGFSAWMVADYFENSAGILFFYIVLMMGCIAGIVYIIRSVRRHVA